MYVKSDGNMAGDVGFDPLGFSKDKVHNITSFSFLLFMITITFLHVS
jgi:hypothetical protein